MENTVKRLVKIRSLSLRKKVGHKLKKMGYKLKKMGYKFEKMGS